MMVIFIPSIHPSIVQGDKLEPIPTDIGRKVGNAPERSPVHHRVTAGDRQSCTLTSTVNSTVHLTYTSQDNGGEYAHANYTKTKQIKNIIRFFYLTRDSREGSATLGSSQKAAINTLPGYRFMFTSAAVPQHLHKPSC